MFIVWGLCCALMSATCVRLLDNDRKDAAFVAGISATLFGIATIATMLSEVP